MNISNVFNLSNNSTLVSSQGMKMQRIYNLFGNKSENFNFPLRSFFSKFNHDRNTGSVAKDATIIYECESFSYHKNVKGKISKGFTWIFPQSRHGIECARAASDAGFWMGPPQWWHRRAENRSWNSTKSLRLQLKIKQKYNFNRNATKIDDKNDKNRKNGKNRYQCRTKINKTLIEYYNWPNPIENLCTQNRPNYDQTFTKTDTKSTIIDEMFKSWKSTKNS